MVLNTMDDTALFANLLVNKSKLKPLSASQSNQPPQSTFTPCVNLDDEVLSGVNQIFAHALQKGNLTVDDAENFLEFMRQEIHHIIGKYRKSCQGKHE